MHFLAVAILDKDAEVDLSSHIDVVYSVNKVVFPYINDYPHDCEKYFYDEADEDSEEFDDSVPCSYCDNFVGDGFVIGGRWTGLLTDYNPEQDPHFMRLCHYCHGFGSYPVLNKNPHFLTLSEILNSPKELESVPCNYCKSGFYIPDSPFFYPGDVTTVEKYKELLSVRDDISPLNILSDYINLTSSVLSREEIINLLNLFPSDSILALIDVHC